MSKRRLTGDRLRQVRAAVRAEQPLCPECLKDGKVRGWDELDHVVPLFMGGTDERSNLEGVCKEHHLKRTRRQMGWKERDGCDANGVPLGRAHHWNT